MWFLSLQRQSKRVRFVRDIVKEVAGLAPYERRATELLKVGRDKRALKLCKRKVCNPDTFAFSSNCLKTLIALTRIESIEWCLGRLLIEDSFNLINIPGARFHCHSKYYCILTVFLLLFQVLCDLRYNPSFSFLFSLSFRLVAFTHIKSQTNKFWTQYH